MNENVNFDDIIQNAYVDTYFQPIVNLSDGNVIGYEALSRGPRGSGFFLPTALIAEAKRHNRAMELDQLLRQMTLVNASKRNLLKPLFINIEPISIYENAVSKSIVRRSGDFGIPPHRVVVEISAKNALCSLDKFQSVVAEYKAEGFKVACDDITGSLTNFDTLSRLNPDYVKISGSFVHNIGQSANVDKTSKLNTIIQIFKMIHAEIIAVGVETVDELKTLYHSGVDAVQGNLIAKPGKEIKGISQTAADVIRSLDKD